MADIVFVGPSLPTDQVAAILPRATVLPPVRHGDLLRLDAGPGDRVLLIDGLFCQVAPVRHREILALLQRGVVVAGSSSMGALRAAELWPYGMRGVGEVFALYRDGIVTGDDEVAVVHAPAEDGYRALSEPLVNIRVALRDAAVAGAISAAEADRLLTVARDLPYPDRSYRALAHATRSGELADEAARFLDWHRDNPWDAKTEDARLLLSMAATGSPTLRPHEPDRDHPIEFVHTRLMARWSLRYHGADVEGGWVSDADVVRTLMLLHPEFPALHRESVLAHAVADGHRDVEGPAAVVGAPDEGPAVEAAAVALARRIGLIGTVPLAGPDGPGRHWLVEAEYGLPEEEAVLRVLVRAFGTETGANANDMLLPAALAGPAVTSVARRFFAAARALDDAVLTRAGSRRYRFRPAAVDQLFGRLWGCDADALVAAAGDRGFADLPAYRAAAEPLVAYLKMFGPPNFPPRSARSSSPAAAGDTRRREPWGRPVSR